MNDGTDKKTSSKKNNFWHNGFTVDETKFSTLMFLLVVAFTYLLVTNILNNYQYTDKIFEVVKWLIGAVVGVNGLQTLTNGQINNYEDWK